MNDSRQTFFVSIFRGANFSLRDLHPTHFHLAHVPRDMPITSLPDGIYSHQHASTIDLVKKSHSELTVISTFPIEARLCSVTLNEHVSGLTENVSVAFDFAPWFDQSTLADSSAQAGINIRIPFVGNRGDIFHDGSISVTLHGKVSAFVPPCSDVRLDLNVNALEHESSNDQTRNVGSDTYAEVLILQNILRARLSRSLPSVTLIDLPTFDSTQLLLLSMMRAVFPTTTLVLRTDTGWKGMPKGWQRYCENIGLLSFETASIHFKSTLAQAVLLDDSLLADLRRDLPVEKLLKYLNRNVDVVPQSCFLGS